jgi:hypothetical protein
LAVVALVDTHEGGYALRQTGEIEIHMFAALRRLPSALVMQLWWIKAVQEEEH